MDQTKETPKPEEKKKRKLRNDLILIGVLLVVLVLTGLAFWLFRGTGDTVVVRVNGEVWNTYPLSVDRTVEIRTGEHGENLNILVIEGRKVWVTEANCKGGYCAAHWPISLDGDTITCLPHRVIITVESNGNPDGNGVDTVTS